MKSFLVGVVLALVALSAPAQEVQLTRGQVHQACIASSMAEGNPEYESTVVCNCVTQWISYTNTNGTSVYADYSISNTDPRLQEAVNLCVKAAQDNPRQFLNRFSSVRASNP